MKTAKLYIIGFIASISLIYLLLYLAFSIPVFNKNFYEYEYEKNNVYNNLLIEKNELMKVTTHMTEYLDNKKNDLNILAEINGEYKEFFLTQEKIHMKDVKNLFIAAKFIRNICVIFFFVSLLISAIFKVDFFEALSKTFIRTFLIIIVSMILLMTFAIINFDVAFEAFHELFFSNDLWLFDPEIYNIVNMLPTQFFMDIAVFIAILFTVFMFLVLIFSIHYLKLKKANFRR